jgi:hypothetical protein
MILTPSTGSYSVGSTISVAIYENSYTTAVNAAQANLTYPTNLLQFQSANNTGGGFPTVVQNSGGNGTVNLGVGILGSSVSGNQLVGTVTFTVIAAGTATIGVATSSAVTDATTSNNILQVRTGSTYTLSAAAVPTIYLNPASGSYASGSTISIAMRENSLTTAVNAVEVNLTYPTARLQFQSVNNTNGAFTTVLSSNGGNGTVNLSVGLLGSSTTGDKLVGTVVFTALSAGSAAIGVASSSAIYDAATSTDISQTKTGSTVTIT